jgi:dihydrofolate reductase
MGKLTALTFVTLDGVMQGPASPEEDTRDGFEHGGWQQQYFDEVLLGIAGEGMATENVLLFGRRTYEDFYRYWPTAPQPNPFTDFLNRADKYVASRTLEEPLPWENSTLLKGDAGEAVAELKAGLDKDIAIMGSGRLIQSLRRHDLIDEYTVLIHPLVLGSGRRLFEHGVPPAYLKLVNTKVSTTGVIVARYVRTGRND